MKVNCPNGWKSKCKMGRKTIWLDRTVNICDNICDSPDLCKIETCEYYDISREATRKFQRANALEHGLEGLIERSKDQIKNLI